MSQRWRRQPHAQHVIQYALAAAVAALSVRAAYTEDRVRLLTDVAAAAFVGLVLGFAHANRERVIFMWCVLLFGWPPVMWISLLFVSRAEFDSTMMDMDVADALPYMAVYAALGFAHGNMPRPILWQKSVGGLAILCDAVLTALVSSVQLVDVKLVLKSLALSLVMIYAMLALGFAVAVYFQLSLKALLPVYALLDFPPSPPGTPIRYSQRRDGPATLGNFRDVYLALVATTRVDTWEAARAALRPSVDAVIIDPASAQRFETCAKQLWVLTRMHGKMEPERAFDKLREIVAAMSSECGMPQEVVVAVYSFFETNILAYGAVEFVVEGGFVLPPSDVPALLDRYNWRKNEKRAHVELLLSMCLRAFADFESDMKAASDAGPSIVAVEGSMRRARGRLDAAVQRALQKHGKTGAQGITAEAFSGKIARLAEAREAQVRLELQGRLAALELVSLESAEPAAASSSSATEVQLQAPADVSEVPQASESAVEVGETEQERLAKLLEDTTLE